MTASDKRPAPPGGVIARLSKEILGVPPAL